MDIFEAAKKGDISSLTALIKAGVDVNTVDKYGRTALMYAAHKGQMDAVKLLKEAGAK